MPRQSRRTRQSQQDPNSDEEMEVDSGSEEEVSRTMRRMNVSQNVRKGRNKSRQVVDSDSEEEAPVSQRMNGSRKVPGGKGRPTAIQVNSDSDDEPQPSTSQASQKRKKKNTANQSQRAHQTLSQASTSAAGETLYGEESASQISPNTSLTEQDFDHHVANVVKYILTADLSNNPIERSRISREVDCHNKKFKEIFTKAQAVLKDVFGYDLRELKDEDINDDKVQPKQTKASNPKYILVNTVHCNDEVVRNLCDDGDEETGIHYVLLFLTLSHIFMSGDKCSEDSLKSFLKKLEIITDNHTRHEQFGDAMEVIKKVFTKEKYINYDDKEHEFSWGMRATIELKPRAVMNFISEMYDGRKLDTWPQEYERMLAKEQNQRPNGQVNGVKH